MEEAGADWEVSTYGGASHSFTHADAVPGAIPGAASRMGNIFDKYL
jgi:hypothetical protein